MLREIKNHLIFCFVSIKKIIIGVIFLTVVYLLFWETKNRVQKDGFPLKVYFLNVGQGDAILVDYLGVYQVLIDGGPSGEKLLTQLGERMPLGDKKIEVAVLTHPDKDHLAGFLDLLDNYQVDLFLTNGQKTDSQIFLALERKLQDKNIKTEAVYEGSTFQIGQKLDFFVFNPDQDNMENKEEKNDQSVILQMNFGQNEFLFLADAETETEADLLQDGQLSDIDWLKVAHHGSKNASTDVLLEKTQPEFAVISVGKNSYGHPSEDALGRLKKTGAQILRTDEQGTIGAFCSGLEVPCQSRAFP